MSIKPLKEYSPFILFLPFLCLYILYVLLFHKDEMYGDEARYVEFAQNLLHGFYSPPHPNINLISGPGYSILLMPLVALKLPLISITLLNAVLHFLSIVFVFKTIQVITPSFKISFAVAVCWGCYFLAYQEMAGILTETFTLFLVSAFSYQIINLYSASVFPLTSLITAGLTLGFIILTKVIFAYAVLTLLLLAAIAFLLYRQSAKIVPFACILGISLLTLAPYLVYTYSLTGKFFYLSSEGGKVLYWMTSLNANEYGDWNNNTFTSNCGDPAFCNAHYFVKDHAADIELAYHNKTGIQTDSVFKALAIKNIKSNPIKYIKNWYSNIGRLLFGFPSSYYFQKPTTLVRIYVNSIILLAMLYSLIVSLWNWKSIPVEIKILIGFSMIYLGFSSLVSAYPRQFNIIVPAILIWVSYAFIHTVQVRLKIIDRK